jgi:hypothetical protein
MILARMWMYDKMGKEKTHVSFVLGVSAAEGHA